MKIHLTENLSVFYPQNKKNYSSEPAENGWTCHKMICWTTLSRPEWSILFILAMEDPHFSSQVYFHLPPTLDQPSNGFGGDILTDLCLNPCNLPKRSLNPRNLPSRSPNPRYLPTRKSNPRNSPLRSPKLRYSNLELLELIYFLISTNRPRELTCLNIATRSNFTYISRIWTHFNVTKSKIPCKYQFLQIP